MNTAPHVATDAQSASPVSGLAALVKALSPIHAVGVALRFTREASPGLFHEPALTAMLRTLMGGTLSEEPLLWVQAPEAGRSQYAADEPYRFNLLAAGPVQDLLATALQRLPQLGTRLRGDRKIPFGADLRFEGLRNPIDGRSLPSAEPLTVFDPRHLAAERQRFAGHSHVRVRLLTPLRILRDKAERPGHAKGDARYVHDAAQLPSLFARRVYDSLLTLAKPLGVWLPRPDAEPQASALDVFHIDWAYRDAERGEKSLSGMLGWLDLDLRQHDPAWLDALLIAQRLGIGQRRSFGWGAFRLEAANGSGVVPPRRAERHLLHRAAAHANLRLALAESLPADDAPPLWQAPREGVALPPDAHDLLQTLHQQLGHANYPVPALHGHVLLPPDARLRPLAVPPWQDRLAQRSVARLLTLELETLFSPASFGYRRGRSRHQVREQIRRYHREGYRHYFEADISGFFDHVQWPLLETRLRGLFGDDPAIALILQWLAAPVDYQGARVSRTCGLPQGSPLSPVLANLLLEDLDADCAVHGFKLLRYADDFIVLCRSEREARDAWARAETSIAELGLRLKPEKTRIGHLDDGPSLEFLGFRFVGELSVERSKPKPQPSDLIHIPPRSWLAELVRQQPALQHELQRSWAARHGLAAVPAHTTAPTPAWRATPAAAPAPEAPAPPSSNPESTAPVTSDLSTDSAQADNAENPAAPAMAQPGQGSLLCLTEPALLAQRQGRLLVLNDQTGAREFPWNQLEAVLVFSHARLTSGAVAAALDNGVAIHFLGGKDGYRGRLIPEQAAIDDLDAAIAQQRCFADPPLRLHLTRQLVLARLHNQRETLRQRLRRHNAQHPAIARIGQLMAELESASDAAALNGYEGSAARLYFDALATTLPAWAEFTGRNRRPPRDPFNALLSLGFTILYSRTIGLLHATGFHPRIGFYHQPHGRHAVLASDLMEPFRHLVERTASSVLTRRELTADDFHLHPQQGCRLQPAALRRYLARLAEAMVRPLTALDDSSADFHDHMQRQLRSLNHLRRGEGDLRPWFFRTR